MYPRLFFVLLKCLIAVAASGQIYLDNHSFEGTPKDATTPVGWHACAEFTTPDILPGPWGVFEEPSDGHTFLGLITREDGSYESIGQRLSKPLQKGGCYEFSIDLARSITYANYNQPLKLRIWGGRQRCELDQLILETDRVEHNEWKTYPIQFYAEQEINYIIIEAYDRPGSRNHTGNILLDRITPIRQCAKASLLKEVF